MIDFVSQRWRLVPVKELKISALRLIYDYDNAEFDRIVGIQLAR